ncbi:hypothetical protein BJP40_06835 [Streptomyces sp. CC53]|uniref:hypothetical protein n=1 Tax=Streptomyces sp. CC53 TaxID=1906740 RepID=UPI0008DD5B72|nr:hypothetical protein [Streptomyces sp. CC53]OII61235.1 hypothetical protein BJP40_06835 [Streptomyces sp. CC53]
MDGNRGADVTLGGKVFKALATADSLTKQGRIREARMIMSEVRRMQRAVKFPPRTVSHLKGRWLYRLWAADDTLLYVGITDRGREREREHVRTKIWWPEVHHITVEPIATRAELLHLERVAISRERPRYNTQHNRD